MATLAAEDMDEIRRRIEALEYQRKRDLADAIFENEAEAAKLAADALAAKRP
jgi:hypothetical protein